MTTQTNRAVAIRLPSEDGYHTRREAPSGPVPNASKASILVPVAAAALIPLVRIKNLWGENVPPQPFSCPARSKPGKIYISFIKRFQ